MENNDEDEDIRLALGCGSESEIQEAFRQIDGKYRVPICSWVRHHKYPGISAEDLADVWAETMGELLKTVRSGRYDMERRIASDLCQIISTNAIDARRRHKSRENLIHAFGQVLAGTQAGQKWKAIDQAERRELFDLIRKTALGFSEKQQQVLEAFIANFPESEDMQALRQFTSELTGREETLAAVKSALREVRRKLRAVLARKGYGHTDIGDDDE